MFKNHESRYIIEKTRGDIKVIKKDTSKYWFDALFEEGKQSKEGTEFYFGASNVDPDQDFVFEPDILSGENPGAITRHIWTLNLNEI